MKKFGLFAAVLAILLTACSFFNKDNSIINDGVYSCEVTLEGGSGRATVESPAEVQVSDGSKTVKLVWSSSNYDYMLVADTRYDNEAAVGEHSVFTIPFDEFNESFSVIGDTTAMSTPHEIEYTITVYSPGYENDDSESSGDGAANQSNFGGEKPELKGLEYVSSMELDYAKEYMVDYYKNSSGDMYDFITIGSGEAAQYFLKPEGDAKGLSIDGVVLLSDVDKTYLVSTSVMDLISKINAIDNIRLSGTSAKDWYITAAKDKMKSKDILYAGKYSAPDYELLLSEGCNLAIENTMIYHNPEAKEKLEALGIPVIVERSSYEKNPLGRLEWIKLYGLLYDKNQEAWKFFDSQKQRIEKIQEKSNSGLTVAVFSITSNGQVVVRRTGDYISSMIEMAGGNYVPADLKPSEDNALSTMKITVEDFYIGAGDADILIYNSTIEGEIKSIDQLVSKADILKDFKAVKNKRVYCLDKGYFQISSDVAEFIEDVNGILTGEEDSLTYIYKLED